jgi:hypothetical protein
MIADMLMEEAVGLKDEAFDVEGDGISSCESANSSRKGTDDGGPTPTPIPVLLPGGSRSAYPLRKAYAV